MADTYSQIFYHIVFAVRNREALIHESIKAELYKYITGIIINQKQKLFIINGMPDHVHLLLNCSPDINISALVREVKEHSSKFINARKKNRPGNFYWQAGFGAFSISKKEVANVLNYIKNQEEHHKTKKFKEEYLALLIEHEIDFKEKYLFDFQDF